MYCLLSVKSESKHHDDVFRSDEEVDCLGVGKGTQEEGVGQRMMENKMGWDDTHQERINNTRTCLECCCARSNDRRPSSIGDEAET